MVNWLTRGNWVVQPSFLENPKSGGSTVPSTHIAPENQPFFSRKVVLDPYPSPIHHPGSHALWKCVSMLDAYGDTCCMWFYHPDIMCLQKHRPH